MESKNYSKQVNITKKKQTHSYREQFSGYQWKGEGQYRGGGAGGLNYQV